VPSRIRRNGQRKTISHCFRWRCNSRFSNSLKQRIFSCGFSSKFGLVERIEHLDQCRDVQVVTFRESSRVCVESVMAATAQRNALQIARLLPHSMVAGVCRVDPPRLQARDARQALNESQVRKVPDRLAALVHLAGPDL